MHEGNNPDEIERLVKFADGHPKIINCAVRPVFLVEATDKRLRQLAARRNEGCVYLSPWGMDMLRMHLHQIEAPTELDTQETRHRILEATGGVPGQVVDAVERLIRAEDRAVVLEELDGMFPLPQNLRDKNLAVSLEPLFATDSPDLYALLNEDVKDRLDMDLETLVPDLQAMGIVERWSPQRGMFAPSALGEFLRRQVGVGIVRLTGPEQKKP